MIDFLLNSTTISSVRLSAKSNFFISLPLLSLYEMCMALMYVRYQERKKKRKKEIVSDRNDCKMSVPVGGESSKRKKGSIGK